MWAPGWAEVCFWKWVGKIDSQESGRSKGSLVSMLLWLLWLFYFVCLSCQVRSPALSSCLLCLMLGLPQCDRPNPLAAVSHNMPFLPYGVFNQSSITATELELRQQLLSKILRLFLCVECVCFWHADIRYWVWPFKSGHFMEFCGVLVCTCHEACFQSRNMWAKRLHGGEMWYSAIQS